MANQSHLTFETLRYHLQQHRALYAQGTSPGAAAAQPRQFIEQLLTRDCQGPRSASGPQPPGARQGFLKEEGFFDEDELKRLVEGVYDYLSEVGAHPGVTDVTMGRMARAILLNFGVYLLKKFQAFGL